MKLIESKLLIALGVWLIILPFTGFPRDWKYVLGAVTGAVVAYFGALLFRRSRMQHAGEHREMRSETYTESI
jgi:hypothetical protein